MDFDFDGRKKATLKLDMAPLIDIVFLLLIFFMLTSSFLVQESIELNLPESKTSQSKNEEPINIYLTESGEIYINENLSNITSIQSELNRLKKSESTSVYLHFDQNVKIQNMLSIMDEIRLTGIKDISIATQSKSK
jgi:biopolymer transport protein ExbD